MFRFVIVIFLFIFNITLSQNTSVLDCDGSVDHIESQTPFNFEDLTFKDNSFLPPFSSVPQFIPVVFNKTILNGDTILEASFFVASNNFYPRGNGFYLSFDDGSLYKNTNISIDEPIVINEQVDYIPLYLYTTKINLDYNLLNKMISNRIRFIQINEVSSIMNYSASKNINTLGEYDLSLIIQDILVCFIR